MVPIPSPNPEPNHAIPSLHLQCLNLSSLGACRFFSFTSSPNSLLSNSCTKVLNALYPLGLQSPVNDPSNACSPLIRSITMHLRSFGGVAHTMGSDLDNEHKEVHFSTDFIQGIGGDSSRIRQEIEGVVVHEFVHVFQWNGENTCPSGVIEGIADWVRLKEGLGPPHWNRKGDRWDQGYNVTAYFLDYLSNSLEIPLLVPALNLALRARRWEDGDVLKELLGGQDVEQLWEEYKVIIEASEIAEAEPAPPVPTHI